MFDINDSLFGYISKSNEMTTNIIQRYKNSLIFIGDEKQIYIPTTNSYVGVGLSYINSVINRIPNPNKLYIKDIANNTGTNPNTTYYLPVISGKITNTYYYAYVAENVGINPVSGKFIGGLQGTADYATISHLTYKNATKSTSSDSSYYVSFVNKMNDASYTYVNGKLLYNPNKETLSSTYFEGELKGHATSATYATYSTYTTYTSYSLFNSYQSIHNVNNNANYYITFSKNLSYSLSYVDSQFYYNPALNCVYFGIAYGNIYGNIQGNADTVDGFHANGLFQEFKDSGSQNTYIRIGNTSKTLKIDADKLDGKHLNEIFQEFKNGDNNYAYIKIGNVEKYVQLNAYYLAGTKKEDLFTQFADAGNQTTRITVGGTIKDLKIDADKLDGFHATGLFQTFSGGTISTSGNIITQSNHTIKIGNTEKSAGASSNVKIINSHTVDTLSTSNTENLKIKISVNGVSAEKSITYLHAYYLAGTKKEDLFTQFADAGTQTTRITVGGTTKDLKIDADKLDGFHATGLFQTFSGGTISTSGNIITQSNHTIKIGNTEKSAGASSNVKIINSANWSYVGSTSYTETSYNLVLRYKVNGVDSAYAYIPKIYAYSASYIDGVGASGLFTQFADAGNQTTRITVGGTTKDLKIDADKLDGKHASELFTAFSGGTISTSGNLITQNNHSITIGGTTKTAGASSNVKIINSHTVDTLSTSNTENLKIKVSVNGVSAEKSITYLHAYYLGGTKKEDLFTQFADAGNQTTRITVGGTTKDLKIDADKLDGKHASELFTAFSGGTISTSGNIITQSNHSITIGGTSKSAGATNNVKIINSANWSYVGSTSYTETSYNLVLRYKVNGVDSSYAYIPKIYAYSASYIDGVGASGLFTQFADAGNQTTRITVGGTTKDLKIDADKLDGKHASELFTAFSGGTISTSGNIITQSNHSITIGGTSKSAGASSNVKIINSHTVDTLSTSNTENLKIKVSVNGVSAEKSITYLHAYYLGGTKKEDLFTQFADAGNQTTRITVGGTTKDLKIDADKLDGKHASEFALAHSHPYVKLAGDTMTGALKRYYGSASNDPMIALTSNNLDVWLWRINHGTSANVSTSGVYGFGLKYLGTGDGNNNKLVLYSDAQNGTQVAAMTMLQDGKITLAVSPTAPGFIKSDSSDSYVLLGGGGHKAWGNASGNIAVNNGTICTNLNADMVDGLHTHTGRNSEANKIVRTDANGYIQAGWINTTSGDMGTTAIDKVYVSNDGYIRYKTKANFIAEIRDGGGFDSRYVKKAGDTMTGTLNTAANLYNRIDGTGSGIGALHLNNSDITGVNALLTADLSDSWKESIGFKRTNGNYDTFRGADGKFYVGFDNGANEYLVLHAGNTYVSSGKGYINGAEITKVNEATNSDKLDGYHANGLLETFSGGGITSSGNTLTQANHTLKVGGTTKTAGSSTATIINSHTASGGQLSSSTNTMSLSAHTDVVNGITSSIAASSATIINSLSISTLTSSMATNLTAGITINGKVSDTKVLTDLYARDADKLDGQHGSYYHIHTARSYSSVDALPSGSEGWYNIFTINDSTYGSVICTIKAYAHSSLTFIVSKGYSDTSTLQILQYDNSNNGSYFYVKGVRILNNGKVQALFNKPSANNSSYVSVNINIFSSTGNLRPNATLTLETATLSSSTDPKVLRSLNGTHNNITSDLVGNASTATKWKTARTLTIGNTGKNVDGSGNVSWSLSEIGVASASHTHLITINGTNYTIPASGTVNIGNYLPTAGGTMLGPIKWNDSNALPEQTSPEYFLCLDSFSNGGTTKWTSKANALKAITGLTSSAVGSIAVPIYWTGTKFATVQATFGSQNYGEHNANNIKSNGMWYYSSNGPATTLGATTSDGALYSQAYSTSWAAQIAQDYRNGHLFVRGLNNGTWSTWLKILSNDNTYVSSGKGYIDSTEITKVNEATNSDKLDGYHANGLLETFSGGGITSSGNTLTQANHTLKVGGTTKTAGSSTATIINSHTASGGQLSSSTNTMSLSAHSDSVNGVSASTTASSATIINSLTLTGNKLTSSVNTMSLNVLTTNINGVSASTTASSAQIINSLSVSTLTSTNATNLTAAITINGVASANKSITDLIARQIAQTSISNLSTFTNSANLIYSAAGGGNSVTDKPSSVDAFGVLSFKTADGWYGQLLMSSNTATGIYWRTATSLSGGWKKLLDSSNYTDYVYSKSQADSRYVNVSGDTMTGTLTMKTNGSGSYNQGIRINRINTSSWALLLIGKSGDATSGTGTTTAGDGAWLIGTPASSNSLIFNLNDASENKGLCLKGHGNNDIKWNNNNVAHAGNISNKDATIGTSLTEIATIAGVSIKAKIASYSLSTHLHDDRYVKLSSTEQTIESTISSFAKGIIEFYRSSGNHIAFISFANKDDNGNKRTLGSIGFHSGAVGQLEYRTPDGTYYKIAHAGNVINKAVSLTTAYQIIANIAGVDITAKVAVDNKAASITTSATTLATVAGQNITASVAVSNKAASITTSATTLATVAGQNITASVAVSNKDATIGTSLTEIATVAGVSIKAKIGSYAASNHTHSIKTHGQTYTIPAPGSAAVDIGNYVYVAGDTMTGHLKMQGTKNLGSAWDKGIIAGNDGHNKVVLTYLASSTNGAVIGAHNTDLTAWALLNISGTELVFRNNETERMRLNSSGNFGIGTSSPGEKLHVNGNVRISGDEYIGTGSGSQCHMKYDNTNKCLNFIFD